MFSFTIVILGWILLVIIGTATGVVVHIIIINDMPPPDRLGAKLSRLYIAGAIGGLIGAALFGQPILQNDATPGRQIISLIGVAATALVVVGVTALASGLHNKQVATR